MKIGSSPGKIILHNSFEFLLNTPNSYEQFLDSSQYHQRSIIFNNLFLIDRESSRSLLFGWGAVLEGTMELVKELFQELRSLPDWRENNDASRIKM